MKLFNALILLAGLAFSFSGAAVEIAPGQSITVQCKSGGGSPLPVLTAGWYGLLEGSCGCNRIEVSGTSTISAQICGSNRLYRRADDGIYYWGASNKIMLMGPRSFRLVSEAERCVYEFGL